MSKHKKKQYVQTEPKKQSGGFLLKFVTFLGVISIFNAVFMFLSGFGTFQTQWDQTEWTVTTAQVVEVTQGNSADGDATPTQIRYEYQVDGTTHQGTYQQSAEGVSVGSTIPVRYDPDHPETSTAQMNLDLGFLLMTSVFCAVAIICLYGPAVYQKRKDRTQHRLPVR